MQNKNINTEQFSISRSLQQTDQHEVIVETTAYNNLGETLLNILTEHFTVGTSALSLTISNLGRSTLSQQSRYQPSEGNDKKQERSSRNYWI